MMAATAAQLGRGVSEPRIMRVCAIALVLMVLIAQGTSPTLADDPAPGTPAPAPSGGNEPPGADGNSGLDGGEQPDTAPEVGPNPELLDTLDATGGVLVGYRADGWRYRQVVHGAEPGFDEPAYDDAAWSTGGAPFGTTHTGCPLGPQVRTGWIVDTDLLLRRTIAVSEPLEPLAVTVTVDNDVEVYWNGELLAAPPSKEGCAAYDDYQFQVPVESQLAGDNLLAVRAIDRGYASFIDVAVYPSRLGCVPAERWPGGKDPNQTNPTGSESDPVNTLTGAYYTSVTDLRLPGRGIDFEFRRDYSSGLAASGVLGPGWVHPYAAHLSFEPDGLVYYHSETGATVPFFDDGSNGFYPAIGVLSKLARAGTGYVLTRPDFLVHAFNAAGQLTSIKDRNNNQLTLSYTGTQLTAITDTVGRQVSLTYHPDGRLATVVGPPSRTVSYTYDATGRLATVTDARGKLTSYTYEPGGRLERIVDANDHTVVFNEYGPDGRVIAQTDARGKRGTFAWNAATEVSTYTDARGGEWIDDYDGSLLVAETDPLGNTTAYTYDAALQLTSIRDARGNTTHVTYDRRGNLLRRQAPAPLSYVEKWGYTIRNDLAVHIDGRGNYTYFGYDASGDLTSIDGPGTSDWSYGRTSAGLMSSMTDPRGKTTTYGYDAQANRNRVTTHLGNVTTMTFDGASRMLTMVEPRGNVVGANPAHYTTSFTYDAADHRLTTTDPLGNVATNTYDDVGNLATATDANEHTTSYAYDEANNLTTVTDARGGTTTYAYDDVGNLVSRRDANLHITEYSYDLAKRMTSTTDALDRVWTFDYDGNGNLETRTDARNHTVTFGYDALNRLTTITYADPSTPNVSFGYDANSNRISMSDGSGTETYGYNALNLLTSASRGGATFTYAYDAAGNPIGRTYPGQTQQSLTYNDDGRLAAANGATYTYDPDGNTLAVAGPDGVTARYSYDRAGRLTEVANTTSVGTLSRFTYAVDPVGNRTAVTSREGTVTHRYDELDRLTESCWSATTCPGGPPAAPLPCQACIGGLLSRPAATVVPPGGETHRAYTYDPVGNRITEGSEAGTTTYTYDAADQLTGLTGGTFPGAIASQPASNTGAWTSGHSGYASDNAYATAAPAKNQTLAQRYGAYGFAAIPAGATVGRVTVTVEWAVSASNAQATLAAQAYVNGSPHGPALTNASRPTSDTVQTLELTGLSREQLATGNFQVEVRASRGGGGSNFTARLDAVTVTVDYTSTNQTQTYDANGNQTSAGPVTYSYDRADRLRTATVGSTIETYDYAGDGARLRSSTGSGANQVTNWLWDRAFDLPQLAMERDGSGAVQRSFRYGLDLISETAGTNTALYHHDGLGSVVDVTSSAGASLGWREYYPFGLVRNAGSAPGAPAVQRFGFTGEQQDPLTGLYHLRARQYAPATGRFLTRDPLVPALSDPYVASYVYVRNNPCTFADPSGMVREGAPPIDIFDPDAEVLGCNAMGLGLGIGLMFAGAVLEVGSGLAVVASGGVLTPAAAVSITVGAADIAAGQVLVRQACE